MRRKKKNAGWQGKSFSRPSKISPRDKKRSPFPRDEWRQFLPCVTQFPLTRGKGHALFASKRSLALPPEDIFATRHVRESPIPSEQRALVARYPFDRVNLIYTLRYLYNSYEEDCDYVTNAYLLDSPVNSWTHCCRLTPVFSDTRSPFESSSSHISHSTVTSLITRETTRIENLPCLISPKTALYKTKKRNEKM